MPSRSTPRDRDRRAARDEAMRRNAERSANRRRIIAIGAVVVVLLAVGGTVFAAANSSDPTATTTTTAPTTDSSSTTVAEGPTISVPPGTAGAAIAGPTPCPAEDGSSPRTTSFSQAPPTCIDANLTYDATVTTSLGTFTFFLNTKLAPRSINNFIVLARYHYYDNTPVTNITTATDFVAGSVTNAGNTPGPGYTLPAEYATSGKTTGVVIVPGTIALAPVSDNAVGGPFLVTTGEKGPDLPPTTTVMGVMLSETPDTLLHLIDQLGTQSGGPTKLVTIKSVTIKVVPTTSTSAAG